MAHNVDGNKTNNPNQQVLTKLQQILCLSSESIAVNKPLQLNHMQSYLSSLSQLYPNLRWYYTKAAQTGTFAHPSLMESLPGGYDGQSYQEKQQKHHQQHQYNNTHNSSSQFNIPSSLPISPTNKGTNDVVSNTFTRTTATTHSSNNPNKPDANTITTTRSKTHHNYFSSQRNSSPSHRISLPLYTLESIETSLKLKGFWVDQIVSSYCNVFSVIISLVNSDIFSTKEPIKMPHYRYFVETVLNSPLDLQSELLFAVGSQDKHPLTSIFKDKENNKDQKPGTTSASTSTMTSAPLNTASQQQQAAMAAFMLTTNQNKLSQQQAAQVAQRYKRPFGGISGTGILATRQHVFGVKLSANDLYESV
jgi:hypothetical protein